MTKKKDKNIEVIVCASEEGNKMMCVNVSKTNKNINNNNNNNK